ncbi:MAG: hypothetical protein J5J00_08890 [Deltaproteobacteria bacterium]|nr:hypothetical protein [Deltaproteobacteria bacterium]
MVNKRLDRSLAFRLLQIALRPVVDFCLRRSLRLQDLIEASKSTFVRSALRRTFPPPKKVNVSRLSLMTGVHRRDVIRILKEDSQEGYEKDLITKVIGRWLTDQEFITKDRSPRVLSFEGAGSDFARLVSAVSTDVNSGAVLFELERIGAVVRSPRGLRLIVESHVPKGDPAQGFEIMSKDAQDLTRAVEENVIDEIALSHLHARTEFDNVRPEAITELKRWFLREGHVFHAKVREAVSKHDEDINPSAKHGKKKGVRVVYTSFSYIEEDE